MTLCNACGLRSAKRPCPIWDDLGHQQAMAKGTGAVAPNGAAYQPPHSLYRQPIGIPLCPPPPQPPQATHEAAELILTELPAPAPPQPAPPAPVPPQPAPPQPDPPQAAMPFQPQPPAATYLATAPRTMVCLQTVTTPSTILATAAPAFAAGSHVVEPVGVPTQASTVVRAVTVSMPPNFGAPPLVGTAFAWPYPGPYTLTLQRLG